MDDVYAEFVELLYEDAEHLEEWEEEEDETDNLFPYRSSLDERQAYGLSGYKIA